MDGQEQEIPVVTQTHVSRRTITLITVLAIFTVFFLYLALTIPTPNHPVMTKQKPTPTPFQTATLTLETLPSSASAKQIAAVVVNPGINKVTVVQLSIGFDPKIVQNITITPGDFFPDPIELTKSINYKTGTIFYTVGLKPKEPGVTTVGNIAIISYQFSPTATASDSTQLVFLSKTQVNAEGFIPSVLKSTKGLTIPLSPQPSTVTPSR